MSITIRNLHFTYEKEPNKHYVLENVSFSIERGEFIGLCGHTGSGKSTLVQLLAGLLKPTRGEILIDGVDITQKSEQARQARQQVGLVFQYPEHQLFEETIAKDIAFGPKNMGLDEQAQLDCVKKALRMVDLDFDTWHDQSPFDASGGQKRKIAIAGVLAMSPTYLILDEPTAGLDPWGRKAILDEIAALGKRLNMAIILVSHSMDDVAFYADRILVLDHGRLVMEGLPEEVFARYDALKAIGLGVPQITELMHELKAHGLAVNTLALTPNAAYESILQALSEKGGLPC